MKIVSNKFLNIGLAVAFAATFAGAASAPVLARGVSRDLKVKIGLPSCGSPYKCLNNSILEGEGGWIPHLDPAWISDVPSAIVSNATYGQLVHLLPNGKPGLFFAKSYKLSKNHLKWTFTLRKGLKFADGNKVTACDFKWSLARAALPSLGSPVTQYYDHFIAGVDAIANGGNNETIGQAMKKLTGMACNDKKGIVTIKTVGKVPFLLADLTYPTDSVLDPKAMAQAGGAEYSDHNYLRNTCDVAQETSSGPFMFACTKTGTDPTWGNFFPAGTTQNLELQPNPNYKKGFGHNAKVIMTNRVSATVDAGFSDYETGGPTSYDVTGFPSNQKKSILKSCPHPKPAGSKVCKVGGQGSILFKNTTWTTFYFTPNVAKYYDPSHPSKGGSPMYHTACRLAFAYGINQKQIAKVFHGTWQPIYSVLPKGIPGYVGNNPKAVLSYNPKKAESEMHTCLKELGKKGHPAKKLTVTFPYANTGTDAVNEVNKIQNTENKIKGMNVQLQLYTVNDFFTDAAENLSQNQIQVMSGGWAADFPDGWDFETLLLRAGQNYDNGNWGCSGGIGACTGGPAKDYCDTKKACAAAKKYDHLVDKAQTSFNQSQRTKLYRQAGIIALDQGAMVMQGNPIGYGLVRSNVHGFVGTPAYGAFVPKGDDWTKLKVS